MHGTAGRAREDWGGSPLPGTGTAWPRPRRDAGLLAMDGGGDGGRIGAGLGSSRRSGRGGETGGTGGEKGRVRFSHGGEGPREQRGPAVGKRLGGRGGGEKERERGGPG